jgi:hypothetical protein
MPMAKFSDLLYICTVTSVGWITDDLDYLLTVDCYLPKFSECLPAS